MDFQLTQDIARLWTGLAWLLMFFTCLIHFLFATGVARDAGRLEREGEKTEFVDGLIWAFATLLGGVFVAAVYWLIHHSTLRKARLWSGKPV